MEVYYVYREGWFETLDYYLTLLIQPLYGLCIMLVGFSAVMETLISYVVYKYTGALPIIHGVLKSSIEDVLIREYINPIVIILSLYTILIFLSLYIISWAGELVFKGKCFIIIYILTWAIAIASTVWCLYIGVQHFSHALSLAYP